MTRKIALRFAVMTAFGLFAASAMPVGNAAAQTGTPRAVPDAECREGGFHPVHAPRCLGTCSRTGDVLWYAGRYPDIVQFQCGVRIRQACEKVNAGERTHACWGHF